MATQINPKRPVVRETQATDEKLRRLSVKLLPFFMEIHIKGTHQTVMVPYESALDLGRKLAARELLIERNRRAS